MRSTILALATILVMTLAACTGTSGGASTPTGASSATTSAGATSTAVPSADESGGGRGGAIGLLCAQDHQPCPLDAGTYSSEPFTPAFTFNINDGWTNDRNFPDGGGISQQTGGIYWASAVSKGSVGQRQVEIGPSVDEMVAFLQTLTDAGATVSDPAPAELDGATGKQVDVQAGSEALGGIYLIAEDAFNLAPSEKARFMVLDQGGETVAVVLDSFDGADFDTWVASAQEVLDTWSWE